MESSAPGEGLDPGPGRLKFTCPESTGQTDDVGGMLRGPAAKPCRVVAIPSVATRRDSRAACSFGQASLPSIRVPGPGQRPAGTGSSPLSTPPRPEGLLPLGDGQPRHVRREQLLRYSKYQAGRTDGDAHEKQQNVHGAEGQEPRGQDYGRPRHNIEHCSGHK